MYKDGVNKFGIQHKNIVDPEIVNQLKWTAGYHEHGSTQFNDIICGIEDEHDVRFMFNPCLPVKTVYQDFSKISMVDANKVKLQQLFLKDRTQDGDSMLYNVKYGPDEYPPKLGYYYNTFLELLQRNGIPVTHETDGFMTTIFYGMYTWYNGFDTDRNTWNRPTSLFVNNEKKWLVHPGRSRMEYMQFADTNTPMFLCVGNDIEMPEYTDTAIPLRDNIDHCYEVMREISGYDKLEIRLRHLDGVCDLQYTQVEDGNSFSGEIYPIYYGKKLLVKFIDSVILFNDEPVAYIEDDLIYFYDTIPKFELKE